MNSTPPFRKLRGYTFDPALSSKLDTASINQIVYHIPWEDLTLSWKEELKKKTDSSYEPQGPGPVGEYIEVIDFDPTTGKYYKPVDLNDPYILAQDGLDPSEGNPLFHQQMVYSVAMKTISNFEKALGRKVLWASRQLADKKKYEEYVQRLRIYPHALREANAYYSPQKKALMFGYFHSTPADITLQMPGTTVFTCLNHDIIAHETTHAILDGMHRYYNEATNPDVLAFHEAFADIVALFQHFTFTEVLKNQIARTRGDIGAQQNLLGEIAQEFGSAVGKYGSLRGAIGEIDENTQKWKPIVPKADDYANKMEPHERGSILVAAVFEAFINIYKKRAADLLRIYSNGTGILPEGELHPDLVNRLAGEAAKAAKHILGMCIRALDYCPPVDLTFGEFLRAIITADKDLVADDSWDYRLSFIEAFRRRGIYPQGIKTMSEESLRYNLPRIKSNNILDLLDIISNFLRDYRKEIMYTTDRNAIYDTSRKYMGGGKNIVGFKSLHERIFEKFNAHSEFIFENSSEFETLTGLIFKDWSSFGISNSKSYETVKGPSLHIQQLRVVSRVGPDGNQINQIIFAITQRCGVVLKNDEFCGDHFFPDETIPEGGMIIRGGCTLIFDLDSLELKYAISKPLLDIKIRPNNICREISRSRIEQQYDYQYNYLMLNAGEHSRYFNITSDNVLNEPFALLHQH
jgi:hypothetical protein